MEDSKTIKLSAGDVTLEVESLRTLVHNILLPQCITPDGYNVCWIYFKNVNHILRAEFTIYCHNKDNMIAVAVYLHNMVKYYYQPHDWPSFIPVLSSPDCISLATELYRHYYPGHCIECNGQHSGQKHDETDLLLECMLNVPEHFVFCPSTKKTFAVINNFGVLYCFVLRSKCYYKTHVLVRKSPKKTKSVVSTEHRDFFKSALLPVTQQALATTPRLHCIALNRKTWGKFLELAVNCRCFK